MKVVFPASLVAACYEASCRPPTSGGSGGSKVRSLGGDRGRHVMPQIPKSHQSDFDRFMSAQGVTSVRGATDVGKLKPTQSEFNQSKVDAMITSGAYRNKPVKISVDNRILDGHHGWQAAVQNGDRKIQTIRYSASIGKMLILADQFARKHNIPKKTINDIGLVAACYDAACRPPTSGGTGGSSKSRSTVRATDSPHYKSRSASDVGAMSESEARELSLKDPVATRVMGEGHVISDGMAVGVRANLNLKKITGVTLQTIHQGTDAQLKKGTGMFGGKAIGYDSAVTLKDVNFSVNQTARAAIAEGKQNKFPMASVDGRYVKNPDPATRFDGIEVRFNPMKQHVFVDPDGRAVKSASEVTVVGSSVFVRGDVTYYTAKDLPENKSTVPSSATV